MPRWIHGFRWVWMMKAEVRLRSVFLHPGHILVAASRAGPGYKRESGNPASAQFRDRFQWDSWSDAACGGVLDRYCRSSARGTRCGLGRLRLDLKFRRIVRAPWLPAIEPACLPWRFAILMAEATRRTGHVPGRVRAAERGRTSSFRRSASIASNPLPGQRAIGRCRESTRVSPKNVWHRGRTRLRAYPRLKMSAHVALRFRLPSA